MFTEDSMKLGFAFSIQLDRTQLVRLLSLRDNYSLIDIRYFENLCFIHFVLVFSGGRINLSPITTILGGSSSLNVSLSLL